MLWRKYQACLAATTVTPRFVLTFSTGLEEIVADLGQFWQLPFDCESLRTPDSPEYTLI